MKALPPEMLVPHAHLEAYLMDPNPYDWGPLLAPYSPPLPQQGAVILASFFGDVFVEDAQGAVWWVNGLEEDVRKIAINREQALQRISDEHFLMLKAKLMDQLILANMLVPKGSIYGLKTPRGEGGKYLPENIGSAPIPDAFAFMGERFRQANAPKAPKPLGADPLVMPNLGEKKDDRKGLWGKKK